MSTFCLAPLAPTASADTGAGSGSDSTGALSDQQSSVQHKIGTIQQALEDASAATVEAHSALVAADAQLPTARRAVSTAVGAVLGAQAMADAAAHAAAVAAQQVQAARSALGLAQRTLDQRRIVIADYVRSSYKSGPTGTATMVLAGVDPADLLDQQVAREATSARLSGELQALEMARLAVASQQADLTARQQDAQQSALARQSALDRSRQAAGQALSAQSQLQSVISARAAAVTRAKAAEDADRHQLAVLQAQSQRIAALLAAAAARPRPSGAPIVGPSGLLWPTQGPVTSPFGYRTNPINGQRSFHAGVDIGAPMGQAIYAAQAGVIAYAGVAQGYGNYTCIDHGQSFATCYAHQSAILVTLGQIVVRGQQIGDVGSTGYSTGPHLHFETRVNGQPVNPLQYF